MGELVKLLILALALVKGIPFREPFEDKDLLEDLRARLKRDNQDTHFHESQLQHDTRVFETRAIQAISSGKTLVPGSTGQGLFDVSVSIRQDGQLRGKMFQHDLERFEERASVIVEEESTVAKVPLFPLPVLSRMVRRLGHHDEPLIRDLEQQPTNRLDVTEYEYQVSKSLFELISRTRDVDPDPLINSLRLSRQSIPLGAFGSFKPFFDANILPPLEEIGQSLAQFLDLSEGRPVVSASMYATRFAQVLGAERDPNCNDPLLEEDAIRAAGEMIDQMHYSFVRGDESLAFSRSRDKPISSCDFVRADFLARNIISDRTLKRVHESLSESSMMRSNKCCRELSGSHNSRDCEGVQKSVLSSYIVERMSALKYSDVDSGHVDAYIDSLFGDSFGDPNSCVSACEFSLFASLFDGKVSWENGLTKSSMLGQYEPETLFCSFGFEQENAEVMIKFTAFQDMLKSIIIAQQSFGWKDARAFLVEDRPSPVIFAQLQKTATENALDGLEVVSVEEFIRPLFISIACCSSDDVDNPETRINTDQMKEYLQRVANQRIRHQNTAVADFKTIEEVYSETTGTKPLSNVNFEDYRKIIHALVSRNTPLARLLLSVPESVSLDAEDTLNDYLRKSFVSMGAPVDSLSEAVINADQLQEYLAKREEAGEFTQRSVVTEQLINVLKKQEMSSAEPEEAPLLHFPGLNYSQFRELFVRRAPLIADMELRNEIFGSMFEKDEVVPQQNLDQLIAAVSMYIAFASHGDVTLASLPDPYRSQAYIQLQKQRGGSDSEESSSSVSSATLETHVPLNTFVDTWVECHRSCNPGLVKASMVAQELHMSQAPTERDPVAKQYRTKRMEIPPARTDVEEINLRHVEWDADRIKEDIKLRTVRLLRRLGLDTHDVSGEAPLSEEAPAKILAKFRRNVAEAIAKYSLIDIDGIITALETKFINQADISQEAFDSEFRAQLSTRVTGPDESSYWVRSAVLHDFQLRSKFSKSNVIRELAQQLDSALSRLQPHKDGVPQPLSDGDLLQLEELMDRVSSMTHAQLSALEATIREKTAVENPHTIQEILRELGRSSDPTGDGEQVRTHSVVLAANQLRHVVDRAASTAVKRQAFFSELNGSGTSPSALAQAITRAYAGELSVVDLKQAFAAATQSASEGVAFATRLKDYAQFMKFSR